MPVYYTHLEEAQRVVDYVATELKKADCEIPASLIRFLLHGSEKLRQKACPLQKAPVPAILSAPQSTLTAALLLIGA